MDNLTKAQALKFLILKLKKDKNVVIPKLIFFEKVSYLKNKKGIVKKILNNFSKNIIF